MSWSFQNNIYLILLFFGPKNFEAFSEGVKDPEAPLMIITTSELIEYPTLTDGMQTSKLYFIFSYNEK